MIQTVAVTSFRMSLNLYWTFKFSSIPPQILSGYIIVAHFLLQSWWHLKERFFFWWFLSSSSVPMCWAFEMRTGSKQLCGIFFVVLCFTKLSNGIACRFSHCFCWTCFSFLFEETSVSILVGMVESLTSLSRSWIKQYSNNLHCPLAQPFRALCHRSLLLFILMAYF